MCFKREKLAFYYQILCFSARVDDFQGKKLRKSNDIENLLVERLGGGVVRLNDFSLRGLNSLAFVNRWFHLLTIIIIRPYVHSEKG